MAIGCCLALILMRPGSSSAFQFPDEPFPTVVAINDTFNVDENSSGVSLSVLDNDLVRPDIVVTIVSVMQPSAGGTVAIAAGGQRLIYSPATNFTGVEVFQYTIAGAEQASSATVTVQVFPNTDGALTARDDVFMLDEDSAPTELHVLTNDSSTPGSLVRILSVGLPSAGGNVMIAPDGLSVIYWPAANFFGEESFQYTIGSEEGLTSSATVIIQVVPIIDNSIAQDDEYTVDADSVSNQLNVIDNDLELRADSLHLVSVTQPDRGGSVTIAADGRQLLYTPAMSFTGTETFDYQICDDLGDCDTAKVTVTVRPSSNFNYVDSNNNRQFDIGIDVPLIQGELEDGSFSTTKLEGGYTQIVAGAGLVINNPLSAKRHLDVRAEGNIDVRAMLAAGHGIHLHGNSIDVHAPITAGRDLELHARSDLGLIGMSLTSGRDLRLTAGGSISAYGTSLVSHDRDVVADAQADLLFNGAHINADGNIDLHADGLLIAANAVFESGLDVAIRTKSSYFEPPADYVPMPTVQVEMTLDQTKIVAAREVELKADQGSVSLYGIDADCGAKMKVTAKETIFAAMAHAVARKEISFHAHSIVGKPQLTSPKIKLK